METLRHRLSRRLRSLMDANPSLDTQTKVSKRAHVSQSTVQRVLAADVPATLDVVESLGKAFNLKPPSLILSDELEAEMLKVWVALNELDKKEVQRLALHLAGRSHGVPAQPTLEFLVKHEVAPPVKAANLRASARPTKKQDTQEQCPPLGSSSKTRSPASSSPSPARPRTRSA